MRGGCWAVLFLLAVAGVESGRVFGQEPSLDRPRVAGRVIDETGVPVAGATVFWSPNDRTSTQIACDEQGRFELVAPTELPAAADFDRMGYLWVVAEGHALEIVEAKGFRTPAELAERKDIALVRPILFTLRVVDPDERPRAGELVEPLHFVVGNRSHVLVPRAVTDCLGGITDAEGQYPARYLKPQTKVGFRVVSEQYGVQQESSAVPRGIAGLVTFQLQPAARLKGVTLGDNPKAFAGTRLTVLTYDPVGVLDGNERRVSLTNGHASVIVDEEGKFDIRIAAGSLSIHSDRQGQMNGPVIAAPKAITTGETASVTLKPEPMAVFIGGVVTEKTNEPVANAVVTLSAGKRRPPVVAKTDANGEFRITSFAATSELTAASPDGIVHCREAVRVEVAAGIAEVHCPPILLPPIRRIAGRLIDARGQAIADVEVSGLQGAIYHGNGKTSKDGTFELITSAERIITDYRVELGGKTRTVTIRSREPLELVLDEPANK